MPAQKLITSISGLTHRRRTSKKLAVNAESYQPKVNFPEYTNMGWQSFKDVHTISHGLTPLTPQTPIDFSSPDKGAIQATHPRK